MKWAVLVGLLSSAGAAAQPASAPSQDGDVAQVRKRYDYGQFSEVEGVSQALLDRGGLTSAQLAEIHLYAGLAAFNLKSAALAERHFAALLRVDPDAKLDPFLAPPPALRAFEALRTQMAAELDRLRAARMEANRAAAAEGDEQARRRQLEAQARQASARQSRRSLWVDFIPFGAGQFQQGRTGAGIAFAVSELALALTSVISFLVYNGLHETVTLSVNNQGLGGTGLVQIVGIPRSRQRTAEAMRWLNLGSSVGFYGVYAGGVVEALVRHRDEEPPPPVTLGAQGAGLRLSWRF